MTRLVQERFAHRHVVVALACAALAILLCHAVDVRAQLAKYNVPATGDYVPCRLRNGTQKSYCPANMTCVPSQVPEGVYVAGLSDADTVFMEYSAPGCCPNADDVACFSPQSRVYAPACCPNATVCCFDVTLPQMPFVGCAQDSRQCCGTNICPLGYSCCATDSYTYCCPGLDACSAVIDTNASSAENGTVLSFVPNTFGTPAESNDGIPRRIQYTECARVDNNTRTNWTDSEAFPCGVERSWCLNSTDYVCVNSVGAPMNSTNRTVLEQHGAFCCEENTTACVRYGTHLSNPTVFGCADESIGEECCGTQVCPSTSRCCNVPSPSSWETSVTSQLLVPRADSVQNASISSLTAQCCPLGTYCCAILIPAASGPDGSEEVMTFCGRNENCTSIATASESVQALPAFDGVLPDYIESLGGWITEIEKNSYFAEQKQNTCNCLDSDKAQCKDQLQFFPHGVDNNDCGC